MRRARRPAKTMASRETTKTVGQKLADHDLICSGPAFPSMRINAMEHEQAMRQGAEDFFGVFTDGLDAAGQRVDERIANRPRYGATE